MPVSIANSDLANGALASYEAFAELIDRLDDEAWSTGTRCTGWDVRDVAGHVVGLANDAATGVPGSRTPDEQATALRKHTPAELAAQLRATVTSLRALVAVLDDAAWSGPSGVPDTTLAEGVNGLWFDTYVHQDDIRAALNLAPERGAAVGASVNHIARLLGDRGWGPATLALDGLPRQDIGAGGRKVTGDPYQFVIVASGRADPATLGLEPDVNLYP